MTTYGLQGAGEKIRKASVGTGASYGNNENETFDK